MPFLSSFHFAKLIVPYRKKILPIHEPTWEKGNTYINGLLKIVRSFIRYCYEEGYGGFQTKGAFKWCREEKPMIIAFQPDDVKNATELHGI